MSTTAAQAREEEEVLAEPRQPRLTHDVKALAKRLVACLFGGFVLALMVGPQEGTLTDFGIAFREAVLRPRIFVFLAIGVLIFLAITLWPLLVPYLTRPGMVPLGAGLLVVIVAQTIMNWYDPLANSSGSGKFRAVGTAVSKTPSLGGLTNSFFGWLAWTLLAAAAVLTLTGIVTRSRLLGYVTAAVGVVAAVIAYLAHQDVVNVGGGIDHSLGVYTDMIGFLILSGAGLTVALARSPVADTRGFLRLVLGFRPGLALAAIGIVLGALAYTSDGWFGTLTRNDTIAKSSSDFRGTGLSALATQYLAWLGYLLFGLAAAVALAATYLRRAYLAWVGVVVSVAGVVLTFLTLQEMTDTAARVAPQYGPTWQNLGTGGYIACLCFTLFAAASVAELSAGRVSRRAAQTVVADAAVPGVAASDEDTFDDRKPSGGWRNLPVHRFVTQARTSGGTRALVVAAFGVALFYPPTLPVTWQNVLVSQIGVYVLLAIGLNVVVGWAGLLDLGYIAFYEIGSYTTAYFTGALPVKPPSWLHMTPLLTIPFAIIACLIAGVLLGAPTLRLRGDYLAIVTLGFGEIIQLISINADKLTGGPIGPNIPHPVLRIGGLSLTWGEDNLPYWYLLLVMLVVVLVLFYRLESSRIGRAWAAIREDEVAAQASGVNVTRIKLLAFAIGASTSALAGTFFASQVGYFDPTLFTLQASILIVAYVVFGGMGSLPGAMAGAAALTWLPQFLKDQVPQDDRQMWIGALVLAMMIFRPAGLLPARRRKAELEGRLGGAESSEARAVPSPGALS